MLWSDHQDILLSEETKVQEKRRDLLLSNMIVTSHNQLDTFNFFKKINEIKNSVIQLYWSHFRGSAATCC